MPRCLGMAIAGALLLAASGCTLDAFLSPTFCVDGPKTVTAGSLSQVSVKLQDGLIDTGMQMWPMKRVGSEVRLAGLTKTQMVFCLYMSAKRDMDGNKTVVRIRWDRRDEELWRLILKILATPASDANDSSGASLAIPSGQDEK